MKTIHTFSYFTLAASLSVLSGSVKADSIAVGDSTLISTLDYSDTFTIGSGSSGTREGTSYNAGDFFLYGNVGNVEDDYGNPAESWGNTSFSINNNANFYTASDSPTPTTGNPGAVDGFTQTGLTDDNGRVDNFGFAYGGGSTPLRNNFVVQADMVQLRDRNDIIISSSSDLSASDSLQIFFRTSGVGIFSQQSKGAAETLTGFTSGLTYGAWENYAVGFDLPDNTLSIYTNGNLLGTVDLNTFANGDYANVLDAESGAYIAIGGADQPQNDNNIGLLWTDNFQVGAAAAAPEPGTWAMMLGGLGLLALITRFHKAIL